MTKRRQTSVLITLATDKQVALLKERGFGRFTDIVRVAIDRMYVTERRRMISQDNEMVYPEMPPELINDPEGQRLWAESVALSFTPWQRAKQRAMALDIMSGPNSPGAAGAAWYLDILDSVEAEGG